MPLKCGGIFIYILIHYTFTAEFHCDSIVIIGEHLTKLWARVRCPVFDSWGGHSCFIILA